MNDHIKRWHSAYQKALSLSSAHDDGVVRAFERFVGTPPLPSDKEGSAIYARLLEDLRQMTDFETKYPIAMVAFGGARLLSDNPYYDLAMEIGEILARKGCLVRTGAGPGIMDAVPLGFKRELSRSESQFTDRQTQGIRIELPFEQAVSPSIDTNTMMKTFAIRRTALIWNSRGIAIFPGGLGTINEMFEAWNGSIDHKVPCPIVVIPNHFYSPFLDAIEKAAVVDRGTIIASDFNLMQRAQTADEAIQLLMQPMHHKAPGTQFTLREKMIYLRHELGRGLSAVSNLPPAVVFMGSKKGLLRTDAEVKFAEELALTILAATSFGIRFGVHNLIDEVITSRAEKNLNSNGTRKDVIQRILMTDEIATQTNGETQTELNNLHIDAHFGSRVAQKETLIHNAVAAFFIPGDIPTLDVLFALVCEIQTGRRQRIPVFLVGCEFWQPIIDGLKESLKGEYDGQFINYIDLDIMTIIGTSPEDVRLALDAVNSAMRTSE